MLLLAAHGMPAHGLLMRGLPREARSHGMPWGCFSCAGCVLAGGTMDWQALYAIGAQKFVVLNIGALGCLPIARANKGENGPLRCNQESNTGAQVFNKLLWTTLRTSSPFLRLFNRAKLVYFDQYAAGLNTLKNMKAQGQPHYSTIPYCAACSEL